MSLRRQADAAQQVLETGGRVEAIQHRVDLKRHHPLVVVNLEGGASS